MPDSDPPDASGLELDLDSSGPSPAAKPSHGLDAGGGDDADSMRIDLDEVMARPTEPRPRSRTPLPGDPFSQRRIHVSRHSKDDRPTGLPRAIGASLIVLALGAATPFIHPDGVALMRTWLAGVAFAPYVALAVALFVAWLLTLSRALANSSAPLHVAAVALIVDLILSALATVYLITRSTTAKAFLRLMPTGAPFAAAAVMLGYGLRALAHAREELRGSDRRVGVGLILLALGVVAVVLAVRVAFGSPLPRIGDATATFSPW